VRRTERSKVGVPVPASDHLRGVTQAVRGSPGALDRWGGDGVGYRWLLTESIAAPWEKLSLVSRLEFRGHFNLVVTYLESRATLHCWAALARITVPGCWPVSHLGEVLMATKKTSRKTAKKTTKKATKKPTKKTMKKATATRTTTRKPVSRAPRREDIQGITPELPDESDWREAARLLKIRPFYAGADSKPFSCLRADLIPMFPPKIKDGNRYDRVNSFSLAPECQ
jgi:hypothetical protein